MLYYTNTRKYCGKDANLQVNVVLCLPTWMGRCSPGHCSHWAKAWPGGNLRASEANKNTSGGADNPLTIFVKKKTARYERLTEDLILAGFDAYNLPLEIGCRGVRNNANHEKNWWHDFPSSVVFVNSNHVSIFHYAWDQVSNPSHI